VIVFGLENHLNISPSHQANSASSLSGTGNEYQPKCGDALRLGSTGMQVWLMPLVDYKRVGGRYKKASIR